MLSLLSIIFDKEPLIYKESSEQVYYSYLNRYLKRSLAPSEYKFARSGKVIVLFCNKERLENEVACLKYIKEKTNILILKVLNAYKENSSFFI